MLKKLIKRNTMINFRLFNLYYNSGVRPAPDYTEFIEIHLVEPVVQHLKKGDSLILHLQHNEAGALQKVLVKNLQEQTVGYLPSEYTATVYSDISQGYSFLCSVSMTEQNHDGFKVWIDMVVYPNVKA